MVSSTLWLLSRTVRGPPCNSLQILKTIARRSPLRSGVSVSRAVVDLHGRLSLRLWQYNARMVLDRLSLLGLDGDSLLSSCDW